MILWHDQGTPGPFGTRNNADVDFDSPENLYYAGGKFGSPPIVINSLYTAALFEAEDIRLTDFYFKHPAFPTAQFLLFWPRNFKFNTAGIRSPEVYLMKAECLARNGDVTGAMAMVNTLRKKRILPSTYANLTASTSEEAVKIIIDERARELMNTQNRFWDMRRLNTETAFAKTYTRDFNSQTYSIAPDSHIFIMPFAKTATDRNESLQQNTK
jgi:hypothetical protein